MASSDASPFQLAIQRGELVRGKCDCDAMRFQWVSPKQIEQRAKCFICQRPLRYYDEEKDEARRVATNIMVAAVNQGVDLESCEILYQRCFDAFVGCYQSTRDIVEAERVAKASAVEQPVAKAS